MVTYFVRNRLTRFRSGNCDPVGCQRSSRPVVIRITKTRRKLKYSGSYDTEGHRDTTYISVVMNLKLVEMRCLDTSRYNGKKRNIFYGTLTGDVKWFAYNNVMLKNPLKNTEWAIVIWRLVMLGVVYYEVFQQNQTLYSKNWHSHLDRVRTTVDEKLPKLTNRKDALFHEGNTRPHISLSILYGTTLDEVFRLPHISTSFLMWIPLISLAFKTS